MKKYFIAAYGFIMPLVVSANGGENPSITHQIEEFLPFEHLEHGHWFAAALSIVLLVSLVYTVYSLIQKFRHE